MAIIKTLLAKTSIKLKILVAIGTSISLLLFYQNCSKTQFGQVLGASQSITGIGALCSLDQMNASAISMSTSNFGSIGLPPSQMPSVPMGATVYLWVNNYSELDGADWYMSMNGGAEAALGEGGQFRYPNAPSADQGLGAGNYRIRINISKICENLSDENGGPTQLSKAQLASSSTIEKNLYVQFSVTDPMSSVCPTLDGLILNADDPKTAKNAVNFSLALPSTCRPLADYNFGDGSAPVANGGGLQSHSYEHAGLYAASAQVVLQDYNARRKSLHKPVVILSECPKPENIFLSGPGLVYTDRAAEFELQNYNNNACNLNVNKVVFKKDLIVANEDSAAPFKQSISWSSANALAAPAINQVVAEVYFNTATGVSSTPLIVKKDVRVVPLGSGCTAEALASVFISGPTSAKVNSTLTHTINIPDCLKTPSLSLTNDIEWTLLVPAVGSAEGELKPRGRSASLIENYTAEGSYKVIARISNTRAGTLLLSQPLNILPTDAPPVCSAFTYSDWQACQPNNMQVRTVLGSTPAGCAGGSPVTSQQCTYVPPVVTCNSFVYSEWGACQQNNTQTRTVLTSSPVNCTGGTPVLSQQCTYVPPTCNAFTYSEWGACRPDNTRVRTVINSSPAGCTGGTPVLSESCTYVPPVCNAFTYSDWGSCQPNNTQTRTVTTSSPMGCAGGTPVTSQSCTYTAPTCNAFTYSGWGACQPNNTQTRTVLTSSPANCTGGTPQLSQACTYTPPTCNAFTYSDWGVCQSNNTQTRTVTGSSPTGCAGGTPVTSQQCTYVPPVCNAFTYSDWGACQPNNTQTRSVNTSSPAGCAGGTPVTSQQCTYVPPVVTCSSFNYSAWGSCQPNNEQTRTVVSGVPAGCTGGTPVLAQACTYVPPVVTCSSFNYSNWGSCQPNNTQSRTVVSGVPSGCTGGTPVLTQACTYVPPTCNAFTYSNWGECQPNNTQSRSVTGSSPSGCTGGSPVVSQQCTYVPPTCSSFTYSGWNACQPNNTQTRSVTGSSPSGCAGGSPVLSQSCTYVPPTCSSFTYTGWNECQSNNTQTRSVTGSSPSGCAGGSPVLSQSCTYVPPTCSSFTYSGWNACQPNNTQSRSVTGSSPAGCTGGSPVTSQSCTYVPPTCSSFTYSGWNECQPNNTQTRSVTGSSPSGCAGGSPVLSQSCTYVPPTCSSFTYSGWGACQPNNTRSRSVTGSSPSGCTGGSPSLTESCTFTCPAGQTLHNQQCFSCSRGGGEFNPSGNPDNVRKTLWQAGCDFDNSWKPPTNLPAPRSQSLWVDQGVTAATQMRVYHMNVECEDGYLLDPNGNGCFRKQYRWIDTGVCSAGCNQQGTISRRCEGFTDMGVFDGNASANLCPATAPTTCQGTCTANDCSSEEVLVGTRCEDNCGGEVVGKFYLRQTVTSGSGSRRTVLVTDQVHAESYCSDNQYSVPRDSPNRTVAYFKQQFGYCMYPGMPKWYDGGRWVGWNYFSSGGMSMMDEGFYKVVRNPKSSYPHGTTPFSSFLQSKQNGHFVYAGGEPYSNQSGWYVCNRQPYTGGGGSGGGGGGGGGGLYEQQQQH